jgi:AcrR family transcriptional regulator
MKMMGNTRDEACKRPYDLRKRQELTGHKRSKILAAARAQLESNGFLHFTMESLAHESGVTRQTIHNLFGTKGGVLEGLFDVLARDAGLERMREVMQQGDPEAMLTGFVEVFTRFWAKDRMLLKRIHGIAAIDSEFGSAVEGRNRRRKMASMRIVERLGKRGTRNDDEESKRRIAALYAVTSFEFFDALAEVYGNTDEAASSVLELVKRAFTAAP